MSQRVSPATDQVYGLQRVTRVWGISRATVYRHRRRSNEVGRRRKPGPSGAMPDEDLVQAIRQLLTDSPFHGEGYRKLWARLRFKGIRTSRRRVLRLMREHGLLAPQRMGAPHGSKAHDGRITTDRVDAMWGTDLTSVMTSEGQATVFVAVDHCSAECVGVHASHRADRFQALEPVRQAVRERFGAFAKNVASGLALRHDHGSQYVSHDFQAEIQFLGIGSSPAFVREPASAGSCRPRCATDRPRAAADGQRLRRALHPAPERKPALGQALQHRRGVAPGAPGIQANLQPDLDHRAARLQDARSGPCRSARPHADGRMNADRCLRIVDRYNTQSVKTTEKGDLTATMRRRG